MTSQRILKYSTYYQISLHNMYKYILWHHVAKMEKGNMEHLFLGLKDVTDHIFK